MGVLLMDWLLPWLKSVARNPRMQPFLLSYPLSYARRLGTCRGFFEMRRVLTGFAIGDQID